MFFIFANTFCQKQTFRELLGDKINSNQIRKIDSFILNNKNKDSLYFYYKDYANWLFKNKNFHKSIFIQHRSLEIVVDLKHEKRIQESYYYLGLNYYKVNDFKNSVNFLNKSIQINNKNFIALNSYNVLAKCFKKNHDYEKSISYFLTVIKLLKDDKKNIEFLRNTYANINFVFLKTENKKYYLKGINYLKESDSLTKYINTSTNLDYYNNIILGNLFSKDYVFNLKDSYFYYNKALEIAENGKDKGKIYEVNLWLGKLFSKIDTKKSVKYLNKILHNTHKKDSTKISDIYTVLADAQVLNKNFKLALNYKFKSIKYLINKNFNNIENINKLTLKKSKHLKLLYLRLNEISKIYLNYYLSNNNVIYLNKSIEYYKLTDNIITLLSVNSEFKSKLFWRKLSTNIYDNAIKACFLSKNIDDAFYFMEKNKAIVLMEEIAEQNFKKELNISKELLIKENKLKNEIIKLEESLVSSDSLLKVRIDLKRTLHSYQDSIYHSRYINKGSNILNITNIKQKIKENEVIIEYHFPKYEINNKLTKNGYVLFFTKERKKIYEIEDLRDLKTELKQYIQQLKEPINTKSDFNQFNKKAYAIYDKLFPTNEIKKLIKNKKLIIVPNAILSFLPFETLITNLENSTYLINSSEISYTYSMSFQEENKKTVRKPKKQFLGIAPLQFNMDSLVKLPNSKNEITNLKKIFTGKLLTNENATKQNFNNNSNNYNIIHFATHADATNEQSPWIAFKNKKLTLPELYTTKTQADLIVLSACNTSLGKIETGEGVMSLVRGFFYSGANSVVSTLWNVNDKTSSTIMLDFYKNLKKGETKSKALHNAKLSYLNTHSLTEASPYYWSSFILIGDAGELASVDPTTNYYIIVGLLVLVCFIFFARRFSQKANI